MWVELAKLGGSFFSILALAWLAKLLNLGGDQRIRDEAKNIADKLTAAAKKASGRAVYGGAGNPQPVPNWASHPAPGFVSNYSQKAVPEDRAELFAAIMTNNLTVRLLLQKDAYLAAKLKVLKGELQGYCPQLDDAFWTRTAKNF